ncbi:hypothetical protein ACFL0W_00545 [Nanoarchaeota archaeon]
MSYKFHENPMHKIEKKNKPKVLICGKCKLKMTKEGKVWTCNECDEKYVDDE